MRVWCCAIARDTRFLYEESVTVPHGGHSVASDRRPCRHLHAAVESYQCGYCTDFWMDFNEPCRDHIPAASRDTARFIGAGDANVKCLGSPGWVEVGAVAHAGAGVVLSDCIEADRVMLPRPPLPGMSTPRCCRLGWDTTHTEAQHNNEHHTHYEQKLSQYTPQQNDLVYGSIYRNICFIEFTGELTFKTRVFECRSPASSILCTASLQDYVHTTIPWSLPQFDLAGHSDD